MEGEKGRERGVEGVEGGEDALVLTRCVFIDINVASLVAVCDGEWWRERESERERGGEREVREKRVLCLLIATWLLLLLYVTVSVK